MLLGCYPGIPETPTPASERARCRQPVPIQNVSTVVWNCIAHARFRATAKPAKSLDREGPSAIECASECGRVVAVHGGRPATDRLKPVESQ